MTTDHYDLMIIGTGPAGLTAALHAARLGLTVVALGDTPGGSTYMIESLDNFPGFPGGIPGAQFGVRAFQQAQQEGVHFTMTRLEHMTEYEGVFRGTDTLGKKYYSSCAVVASGRTPRRLKVPHALFNGVHFCSLCDGPLYRNKNATLAVIGQDNAAGQHALTLSRIADRVLLVGRSKDFQMDTALAGRIHEQKNIELLPGTEVIDYSGNETVSGIVVRDHEGKKKEIAVDGIFLAVGWQINTKMLHLDVDKTPAGYLKTDSKLMTSHRGLFAAGDVRASDMYQVLAACADGARAAKYCFEYLDEKSPFKKD